MKLKLISMLAMSAFAVSATAQDEGFKISGDIATSVFMESGKGANSQYASTGAISSHSGENSGDFSLDQVELNLEKTVGNTGVVLGLGFGRMFDHINYLIGEGTRSPRSSLNITNAYIHHKVADTGLTFKVGKFASGIGYESYRYMDNMNYTRAYSFNSMNPWFLTGIAADYSINEMISVGAVVANGDINLDTDENESKHWGVNAMIKPLEGLFVKLNYLAGKQGDIAAVALPGPLAPLNPALGYAGLGYSDTARINATVGYTFGSMWDVAFHYSNLTVESINVTPATEVEVTSMALYAGVKMETWGAGLRYEMINDDDNVIFAGTANDNSANVITATGWYNLDQNASLKLEVASTSADEKVFMDDSFAADDSMMTYGLGFLYRF